MKALSYNLICSYCGHKNYGQVPIASDNAMLTDCDNCGAYLIKFEMIEYDEDS